jgi:hypothetical protein
MSSCIPWLSRFYTASNDGDCGNVDTESVSSVDSGGSEKSCPRHDVAEDHRRRRRWLRRGSRDPVQRSE